jgi:hypothetical protein
VTGKSLYVRYRDFGGDARANSEAVGLVDVVLLTGGLGITVTEVTTLCEAHSELFARQSARSAEAKTGG